jgi:putative endonuclease
MADSRGARGRAGEEAAAAVYERRGYRVLTRNWRCPAGELDLVLARNGTLVFCEVKTRSGPEFGGGWESVTWEKRRRIRRLAQLFLLGSDQRPSSVRFDVASVVIAGGGSPAVELFEDAF